MVLEVTMKYVLVDVGCIECGEDTEVVGIFDSFEDARAILEKRLENFEEWGYYQQEDEEDGDSPGSVIEFGYYNGGGQHRLEIHRV
jgi:hypothetical protein